MAVSLHSCNLLSPYHLWTMYARERTRPALHSAIRLVENSKSIENKIQSLQILKYTQILVRENIFDIYLNSMDKQVKQTMANKIKLLREKLDTRQLLDTMWSSDSQIYLHVPIYTPHFITINDLLGTKRGMNYIVNCANKMSESQNESREFYVNTLPIEHNYTQNPKIQNIFYTQKHSCIEILNNIPTIWNSHLWRLKLQEDHQYMIINHYDLVTNIDNFSITAPLPNEQTILENMEELTKL